MSDKFKISYLDTIRKFWVLSSDPVYAKVMF